MRRALRVGVLLPAVIMLTAGCASRDWVRDLFVKRDAEMDQRFAGVEGRVNDSSQRADAALGKAQGVDQRLTRLWTNRHSPKVVESVNVYFGFDQSDLSDGAQTALLDLVKELKANPSLTVGLEGYTDPQGAREYNYLLSGRRVEAVRRFMAEKGVQLSRIQSIGLGPIGDRGQPEDKKRRVTVTLMVDQD